MNYDKPGTIEIRVKLTKAFSIVPHCFPRPYSTTSVLIFLSKHRALNTAWISILLDSMMQFFPRSPLFTDFIFPFLLILLISLIRSHYLTLGHTLKIVKSIPSFHEENRSRNISGLLTFQTISVHSSLQYLKLNVVSNWIDSKIWVIYFDTSCFFSPPSNY